jgi:hypothetical protein
MLCLQPVPFNSSNIRRLPLFAATTEESYPMLNRAFNRAGRLFVVPLLVFAFLTSACQQGPATNTTTNTSNTNSNANTANTNTNANTPPITGTTIDTREPDKYSATITLKLASEGEGQTTSLPPLAADFIKNGADSRVSFKVPGGEQVVFLDAGGKRYVIAQNRKQYAELTPESTGFDVPKPMTPGQIISSIKGMTGCERQGEEQWSGRMATKYRCGSKTSTGTQAGDVTSETFVYIDKDTGLPLHSESIVSASGNVQGVKGLKVVTEMSNISTNVDASQFAEPQGMSKVSPEQVKQQVDLVLKAASAILQSIMQSSSTPQSTSAPPAANSSNSAAPPTH